MTVTVEDVTEAQVHVPDSMKGQNSKYQSLELGEIY